MEIVDTHVHLQSKEFDNDRNEVIERAHAAGVTRSIIIGAGDGLASAKEALKLVGNYEKMWASVGLHPHDANDSFELGDLRALATDKRVVAIGETGLDFYRGDSTREMQEKCFRQQISLAKEINLPLIIHSRESLSECIQILKEEKADSVGGVFHCFSGDLEQAYAIFDINFKISIPGIVTFKNASQLQETLKSIDTTQFFLETDAPYLAPVPYRGSRCESSFIVETAKKIAQIKNMHLEELALETTRTAIKFFGLE